MNMDELVTIREIVGDSVLDERVLNETAELIRNLRVPYTDAAALAIFQYALFVASNSVAYVLESLLSNEEIAETIDNILGHFGDEVVKNFENLLD